MVKAASSKTMNWRWLKITANENTRLEKNIEFLNQSDYVIQPEYSHIESSLSPVPFSL